MTGQKIPAAEPSDRPRPGRLKRGCSSCGDKLPGPKGHGFVTRDGKGVLCGRCEKR